MKTYEIVGRMSGGYSLALRTEFIAAKNKADAKERSKFDYIKAVHVRRDIDPLCKIELIFTDPYIGSRNGGNKTLAAGMSYRQARNWLLAKHNELFEKYFTNIATAIRHYKKHKTIDGLFKTKLGYSLDYDSRMFIIEQE